MKTKTTTKKVAKAPAKAKASQPIVIAVEDIDFFLEEIITNAMALQALWQAVTGGRRK